MGNTKKIRIFQADDNDKAPEENKFYNVIEVLLSFLKYDFHDYEDEDGETFNYEQAIEKINIHFEFFTSCEDLETYTNNLEEVKKRFRSEEFDIYIIDLKWGGNQYGGLELLKIINERVLPENIIIYSNHHEVITHHHNDEKYKYRYKHIGTDDINETLPKHLANSIKNIRKKIINNCDENSSSRINHAVKENDLNFFDSFIFYNNYKYLISDLFVGENLSAKNILESIRNNIEAVNHKIILPKSSKLIAIEETFIKKYIVGLSLENNLITQLIDFASINLFLELYFKLKSEDYLTEKYTINKVYIPNNTPKDIEKKTDWIYFYKKIIGRRIFIYWTKYFDYFDENIKNEDKIYKDLSFLMSYGNNYKKTKPITKTYKPLHAQLATRDLGLTTRGRVVIEDDYLYKEEKNFIFGKFDFTNIIKSVIDFIDDMNSISTRKEFDNRPTKCFSLWDIKNNYYNNIIDDSETLKKYKGYVNGEIENYDLFKIDSIKKIFYDEEIKSIEDLFDFISEKSK